MMNSERFILAAFVSATLAYRLTLLTGPLDEPMWRQADTAYMAVRMMHESPPDLLNPKAPYRGTNDVKAAEFPLYPAAAALVYKAMGRESLPAARVVTLVFFAAGAWLLFLSVRLMLGARVAWWTTTLYTLAPLGIAYSRMVHPDFTIIFFSHVFLYALLRFVASGGWGWWGVAVVGGIGAFLMKAPYGFFLGLLPGWWWLTDKDRRTLGRFVGMATVLVLPLAAAIWFNHHRIAQEAPFAESLVYPMKWTSESSAGRFFGTLADRLAIDGWKTIAKRMVWLVLTPFGVVLAVAGLVRSRAAAPLRSAPWVWLTGAVIYGLVVFPMVAGGHEYYTIPLMAPAALLAALGAVRLVDVLQDRLAWRPVVATLMVLALTAAGVRAGLQRGPYLEGLPYFSVDWQRVKAGEAIREHTAPGELVLAATHGRSTGWSDPRILYHAQRRGWAMELRYLDDARLSVYREAGARWLAVLVTPEAETQEHDLGPLAGRPHASVPITRNGQTIGSVRFYRLPPPPDSGLPTPDS